MAEPNCGMLIHVKRIGETFRTAECFDEKLFDEVMDLAAEKNVKTVWLDLGELLRYDTHPELAIPGAMSKEAFRALLRRTREKGITPLPKLNFSCAHNRWMGEYTRMISSKPYYTMCHDIISEVAELFDGPAMFHMGMDEENITVQTDAKLKYIVIRVDDLKWHDVNFYMDEMKAVGSRPVCWSDLFWDDPEGCQKNISKEMVMMPWYYGGIRPEHYLSIHNTFPGWEEWYAQPRYAGLNIEYAEQDPDWIKWRGTLLTLPAAGYDVIPALSNYYGHPYNHEDVMELCRENVKPGQLLGYLTAPWKATVEKNRDALMGSVLAVSDARKKIYGT